MKDEGVERFGGTKDVADAQIRRGQSGSLHAVHVDGF